MRTQEKIKQLEREVATLWTVIEDERLWSPEIIREIQKRSKSARSLYAMGKLKSAERVFEKLP